MWKRLPAQSGLEETQGDTTWTEMRNESAQLVGNFQSTSLDSMLHLLTLAYMMAKYPGLNDA